MFARFTWSPVAVCVAAAAAAGWVGVGVGSHATQGRGERLCGELEVDTAGQTGGGWVQGGVIEALQTSHLEQPNLGL